MRDFMALQMTFALKDFRAPLVWTGVDSAVPPRGQFMYLDAMPLVVFSCLEGRSAPWLFTLVSVAWIMRLIVVLQMSLGFESFLTQFAYVRSLVNVFLFDVIAY